MFRCLECGAEFDVPLCIKETHRLDNPPFEDRYVCQRCHGSNYKPFVKDVISRREVLEGMVDIMRLLNRFEASVCEAFNGSALDGSDFDFARGNLYELITVVAGDGEFDLPDYINEKLFDAKTEGEAFEALKDLVKNIEE